MSKSEFMDSFMKFRSEVSGTDFNNLSTQIMKAYQSAQLRAHNSFFQATSVKAEGLAFCNDQSKILIGNGNKIMRHHLNSDVPQEVVYIHPNGDEKFTFQYMKSDKLLVFSADKITVIDLANNSQILMETTKDQLETDQMYQEIGGKIMIQCHLIDNETSLIMVLLNEIHRLDLTGIEAGQINSTQKYSNKADTRRISVNIKQFINEADTQGQDFFSSHVNEETRSLYVNACYQEGSQMCQVLEFGLDTLEQKRKISVPQHLGYYFYFAENQRKIFFKNFEEPELTVHTISRNLKKLLKNKKYDDVIGEGTPMLAYPEKNMLFTAGVENIRVYDLESDYELSKLIIKGSVRHMKLSPDKTKLLVSSISKDDTEYYIFDLEPLGRNIHTIDGALVEIDRFGNPDIGLMHFIHLGADKKKSVRSFNFHTKKLSQSIHDFSEQENKVKEIVVDKDQQHCYSGFLKSGSVSPQIVKIILATGERVCSIDIDQYFKDKSQIKLYTRVNLNLVTVGDQEEQQLFVFASAKNEDNSRVQVLMTLSCDTLEVTSSKEVVQTDVTAFVWTRYAEKLKKIFVVASHVFKLFYVDFGDQSTGPEMKELAILEKRPTDIEISFDEELVSVGFEDGTIHICQSKYLINDKYYRYLEYRAHEVAICDQNFIGDHEMARIATLDISGKLFVYCLREKTLLLENNAPITWDMAFGRIVFDQAQERMFITQPNNANIEEFNYHLNIDQIEDHINSNLQENINKRFLHKTNHQELQQIVKFVKSDDRYLMNKLNMFAVGTYLGNYKALHLVGRYFEMQTTLEGNTLIQQCMRFRDTNTFDACLEKIVESERVYFNQDTLGIIISSQAQDTSRQFLQNFIIVEAEFNELASKMLPLKGEINQRYLISNDMVLTPEDLDGIVTEQQDDSDKQQKVNIFTLCSKVAMSLGHPACLELLEQYVDASDEHLQVEKAGLYIRALWHYNWNIIFYYFMLNIFSFMILICSVVLTPTSQTMFTVNAFFAFCFILNEFRQLTREGFKSYFSEPFNYLDLLGNIFIIISATDLSQSQGDDFYQSDRNLQILILGILLAGLRACTSLFIFKSYRVQIQLFKQVFIDIFWFMSILMMLIVQMSVVYGVEYALYPDPNYNNEKTTASIRRHFFINIGKFYQFLLSESPYKGNQSYTAWIVYLIFTIIVQIVALNLLIALLSNTFANVYATMNANHHRTQVQILLEISGLKFFYRNDSQDLKCLHFVRYSSEKIFNEEEGDELKSKVKAIKTELETLEETVEGMNEHILDMKEKQLRQDYMLEHIKESQDQMFEFITDQMSKGSMRR